MIKKYLNKTESGVIKSTSGRLHGLVINSHSSGTVKLFDSTEANAQAVGTLTSSGACVPANYASSEIVSSGAMIPGKHAESTFTSSGVVVADQTITLDATVYTAVVTPSAAYDVAMGANAAEFLDNLKLAINDTGTPGVDYGFDTVAHPTVVAHTNTDTTQKVVARLAGTASNAEATTTDFSNGSWADTTLGGGTGTSVAGVATTAATATIGTKVYTVVTALSETAGADAVAYQVVYGGDEATMLDNLKLAINATGTAGTEYSTGTLVHPDVVATTNTDTVQTIRSREIGDDTATTAINAIVTTETMADTAWADSTLGGGTGNSNPAVTTEEATVTIGDTVYTAVVTLAETLTLTAVPFQVLWVTNEATFLDNLKLAINASGTAGTNYGTGTTVHPTVVATTNSATAQVVQAKVGGTGGNSIATTETLGNYAWGATTLASGTGTNGRPIANTITFSAVATTGERFIPFYDLQFDNGLYATIGGTADLTFMYE